MRFPSSDNGQVEVQKPRALLVYATEHYIAALTGRAVQYSVYCLVDCNLCSASGRWPGASSDQFVVDRPTTSLARVRRDLGSLINCLRLHRPCVAVAVLPFDWITDAFPPNSLKNFHASVEVAQIFAEKVNMKTFGSVASRQQKMFMYYLYA